MTTRTKRWLYPVSIVLTLVLGVLAVWSLSSETARARILLSRPLWPATRNYVQAGGVSVQTLLKVYARPRGTEAVENAREVLLGMGGRIVPIVLREQYSKDPDVERGASNIAFAFDERAMEQLLIISLDKKNRSSHQAMSRLLTTANNAGSSLLPVAEMQRVLNLIRKLGNQDSDDLNRTAAMILGMWEFDAGEFVETLSRSKLPNERICAAAACVKALEADRNDHIFFAETILRLLDDPDSRVVSLAAHGSHRLYLAPPEKAALLVKLDRLTNSSDALTRKRAYVALRDAGYSSLARIKNKLRNDRDPQVRAAVSQ